MNDRLILPPATIDDPRLALDDKALALASRNAFPVVAARAARRDGLGMTAGVAVALLLGGVTFWTMSHAREARPVPPRAPEPAAVAAIVPAKAPTPAVIHAPLLHGATPVVPAQPLTAMNIAPSGPDAAHSPLMVFDVSSPPASTPAAPLAVASTGAAKANAPQPLGDTESFAARVGESGVEVASAMPLADPANTITQGTLIAAVLETAIDSDLPGYVRALVSQDVRSFDGSRVLIPRSSRLIGQYKSGLAAGQTRAYVMWTRLIRPDGVSVALASPGTDFAGRSGLSGEVDGHFMKRFGSAMLLSVVGAAGAVASSGTSVVLSTSGQSAASVAAQRDAQIPPTIRVRQGQPIRIFTARDLDFSTVAGDR